MSDKLIQCDNVGCGKTFKYRIEKNRHKKSVNCQQMLNLFGRRQMAHIFATDAIQK